MFWSDSDPGFSRPVRTVPHRRQRYHQSVQRAQPPEKEKESAKPQGPLIIAISIEKQKLRIYDVNGFFAETPISTGMPGHLTPMGVFSVIEKDRYHHSNIYSGAPMPFMQRITWSGVAMHAGVLPGYAASHGCIRMPMAFAMKMWNWTKMGARVVVTPGEMTPTAFSHPLLATQKVVPQPVAAEEAPAADAKTVPMADKTANADMTLKPAISGTSAEPSNPTPLRDQTHTADASSDLPASRAPVTMSDAGGAAPPRDEAAGKAADSAPSVAEPTAAARTGDASSADAKSDATKSDTEPAVAKTEMASAEDKSAETKPAEAAATEEAPAPAQASSEPVKTEVSAGESPKAVEAKTEAKVDDVKTEAPKAEAPKLAEKSIDKPAEMPAEKSSEKPAQSAKAADPVASVPDAKKDQARPPEAQKATTPKPGSKAALAAAAALKPRTGQIAAFVSRKDGKMYVRQNFAPLFDVPVTIAPSDRPLGTHVFTAEVDKNDSNVLHWSVVSLPVPSRSAERHDVDDRYSRRHKNAAPIEVKLVPVVVPDSPAEALDRLHIPAEAMARIAEAMTTGGSLVVSDQGASGETGGGTEFIVSLR